MGTYVGATSRSCQRLVNAVAVEHNDFLLFSFDVSQAFATGSTFEEFSALTGQQIRKVEFYAPKFDLECLRQLPDFKDFDPKYKILIMLKPIYGLKDAPRAWRTKLHEVLTGWLSCRQLYSEIELYCVHRSDGARGGDILVRARQHNEEQQETGKRQVVAQEYKQDSFQCLLSVHVDDIKGMSTKEIADSLLKHLNDKVGQCKADYTSFLHTVIQRESAPGSVFIHQCVYIDSIKPIDPDSLIGKDEESFCDVALHEAYGSVLRAVACTVLTRAELAVYVQALQRRAHAPRIEDCKRLGIVIRYVKRHTCVLKSFALQRPFKFVAFTDAAFKAQPQESIGLALRGFAAVLGEDRGSDTPNGNGGLVNLVDFTVRRQRRLARSTFSAALNGLVDRVEQMLLMQCAMHRIYCGTTQPQST